LFLDLDQGLKKHSLFLIVLVGQEVGIAYTGFLFVTDL
jgi:hypothetical protein